MTPAFTAWNASHVLRWHASTCHALQHSGDTVAAHSGRMATLAHQLWPDDTGLMTACLYHDLPESVTGDVPSEAKRRDSILCAAMRTAEQAVANEHGWPVGDSHHLKFLDRLDAYLWMLRIAPYCAQEDDWRQASEWLLQQAARLNVADQVYPLIKI